MLNPKRLSDYLLYVTTRLEVHYPGDTGVGTAFFFSFKFGEKILPALITNKHVVKGAERGVFFLHESADPQGSVPSAGSFPVIIPNFESFWVDHPSESVDLCAMAAQPVFSAAEEQRKKKVFFRAFDHDQLPTEEVLQDLGAMEDVVMVGYPQGLWDDVHNLPLLRRGITATHPAIDHRGKPEGLVDLACFRGSSGSPVVMCSEGGTLVAKGNSLVPRGERLILMGTLCRGPVMTLSGKIETRDIPVRDIGETEQAAVPIHLGYYIKAKELRALGEALARAKGVLKENGEIV